MDTTVNVSNRTVTVASGESLSGSINLGGLRLFGIVMPAVWTAAGLTFQMSYDGGTTWVNIKDAAGNEFDLVAGVSSYIPVDLDAFAAVTHLKIRSGTAAVPVNQAAARTLNLVLRNY